MKIVISCFLALASVATFAADKTEKVQALMEAQGLVATFEQQIRLGKENCRRQSEQMLTQMMSSLKPTAEFEAKLKAAANDFVTEAQPPWSAQDIVNTWAKFYGSRFTEEELDQLLKYYTSPLAQKEVVVGREAMVQLTNYFQEKYKPVMEKATKTFTERLQLIAKECNCKK